MLYFKPSQSGPSCHCKYTRPQLFVNNSQCGARIICFMSLLVADFVLILLRQLRACHSRVTTFFNFFLQKWLQMTQEDWKEPLYLLKKITMKCFLTFLDVLVQNTFQLMGMPWFTLILILTYFCPQVQRFFSFTSELFVVST